MEHPLFMGLFNSNISQAYARLLRSFPAFDAVIVRVIDSTRSPVHIVNILARAGLQGYVMAGGVVVCSDTLSAAFKANAFSGFDELWFLHGSRPKMDVAIDGDICLTTDAGFVAPDTRAQLKSIMQQIGCRLAFGDGCGLNCATFDASFWMAMHAEFGSPEEWSLQPSE